MKKSLMIIALGLSILFGCVEDPIWVPVDNTDNEPADTIDGVTGATAKDTIPPRIVSTYPSANAVGVNVYEMEIDFSEPISPATASAIALSSGEKLLVSAIKNQVSLIPEFGLKAATTYTVVVPPTVADKAGNKLGQEVRWSFTTQEAEVEEPVEPIEPVWAVPNIGNEFPQIMDVAVDNDGNIYAAGEFQKKGLGLDCFIVKFSDQGKILWQYNVPVLSSPRGGIVIDRGSVYFGVCDKHDGEFSPDKASVYALSAATGEKRWDISCGMYFDIAVDNDGNVYAVCYVRITKISPNGIILDTFTAPGTAVFSGISIASNAIFVTGSDFFGTNGKTSSKTWILTSDMDILWEYQGTEISNVSSGTDIISFSDDIVLIGESFWDIVGNGPIKSFVSCYKENGKGLEKLWQKEFSSGNLNINFFHSEDIENIYVFTRDFANGDGPNSKPRKIDLDGNVLWTSTVPINGPIAVHDGKIFAATYSSALTVLEE